MRWRLWCLLLLVSTSAFIGAAPAADPPVPVDPEITLPVLPAPVTPPAPKPDPSGRVKLVKDAVYPFTVKGTVDISAYPATLLSITTEATLVAGETFRDRQTFFDGTTQKTFKGPLTLYYVRAAGVGAVDLVITPIPLKAAADIKRVGIDVDNGQGPKPPPVDPVVPDPKPVDPKPPTPTTSLHVIMIYESADTLTPAQRGVVYGKAVEDWMTANCTSGKGGWRRRDKDTPGDADTTMAAIWAAVQPKVTVTPCVAVERNGKIEIINLEATPAKMIEALNAYKGAK